MKRTALLLLLFLASVVAFNAQTVEHPDKGSAERAEVLDTIRPRVEQRLKQKVVFVINAINLLGNWVFVDGRLRTPDGKVPNWKNTPYAQAAKYGAQSDGVSALLRKSGKGWTITTYAIGCTDVCYVDWWKRYKAPKAIFPYTE
ncbi:MAG TPA: hypothetical protein VGJ02_08975 [Pyrinomonadaceae bacterium]|jgi:hypothetical protein